MKPLLIIILLSGCQVNSYIPDTTDYINYYACMYRARSTSDIQSCLTILYSYKAKNNTDYNTCINSTKSIQEIKDCLKQVIKIK